MLFVYFTKDYWLFHLFSSSSFYFSKKIFFHPSIVFLYSTCLVFLECPQCLGVLTAILLHFWIGLCLLSWSSTWSSRSEIIFYPPWYILLIVLSILSSLSDGFALVFLLVDFLSNYPHCSSVFQLLIFHTKS